MSADRSSERTPVAPRQPMRAAQESGDWASVLDEAGVLYDENAVAPDAFDTMIAAFEGQADLDFDVDAGWGEPSESIVRASATAPAHPSHPVSGHADAGERATEARRPPSSSRTKVGPFGPSTERALRSLDPREPSIETTRLDLFVSPAPSPEPDPVVEEPPRSYRTRVGLYFVPREPATEPSLPDEPTGSLPMPARARRRPGFFARLFARLFGA